MRLAIACDHAGHTLKKVIIEHFRKDNIELVDLGASEAEGSVNYPIYATKLANEIAAKHYELGILICGTGTGMAIAANKVKGIRAANCANEFMAIMARAHNDANILALGQRVVGEGLAIAIVDAFIKTTFDGGRHQLRLDLIS